MTRSVVEARSGVNGLDELRWLLVPCFCPVANLFDERARLDVCPIMSEGSCELAPPNWLVFGDLLYRS